MNENDIFVLTVKEESIDDITGKPSQSEDIIYVIATDEDAIKKFKKKHKKPELKGINTSTRWTVIKENKMGVTGQQYDKLKKFIESKNVKNGKYIRIIRKNNIPKNGNAAVKFVLEEVPLS